MVVIYREWLQRESKKAFEVGQVWYLISMGWWISWIEYVTPQVSDKHPSLFLHGNFAFNLSDIR